MYSFVEMAIFFVIICCESGQSSQYGGVVKPSETTRANWIHKDKMKTQTLLTSSLLDVKTNSQNNQLKLILEETITEYFMVSIECSYGNKLSISVSVLEMSDILQIKGQRNFTLICKHYNREIDNDNDRTTDPVTFKTKTDANSADGKIVLLTVVNITLESRMIGVNSLVFEINDIDTGNFIPSNNSAIIDVIVIREMQPVDLAFLVTVYVIEILEMLTFGTQLDLDIVKHTLKTPIPLLIGLLCQYVGMPLISFAIAKAVSSDSLTAIGIFVAGVCPGGGSSNIYAYLLDGDLSLSITMTTFSTVLSLAMLPLWLYTLGSQLLQANDLDIPYEEIIVTLSVMLVPLSVGLLIRNKFPKVTELIEKTMTVVLTVLALILITTGVFSSLYLFKMFNSTIIIIGCLLPYIGFCLGAVLSLLLKQPAKNIKTIAIETGMQNTGIAIILLLNSLPLPFGDIATVAPVSAEVMSPIPPFLASIAYILWKKCCKKYEKVKLGESEKNMSVNELHKIYETDKEVAQNGKNQVTRDF